MKIETLKISDIKPNENNPRTIRDEKYNKLLQSIKDFPEMLKLRPIVLNSDYVVIGGNMRYKACKEAGLKEVPVIIAKQLTPEQEREFAIKDNISNGDWNWSALLEGWDSTELVGWGFDSYSFSTVETVFGGFKDEEEEGTDTPLAEISYSDEPKITDNGYVRYEIVLKEEDKKLLNSVVNSVKKTMQYTNAEALMHIIRAYKAQGK
jgi:hypothetical protein